MYSVLKDPRFAEEWFYLAHHPERMRRAARGIHPHTSYQRTKIYLTEK